MAKRIALVTGGIGGIGTAICRRLEAGGARVVANHLAGESEQARGWLKGQQEAGFDFGLAPGDVSDYDDCARMVADLTSAVGPVDILVNCAGITRDKTLRKMAPEHWAAVLDINLTGLFNVTKQVIDGMVDRGEGRIVNVSSINGQQGQFGQTNYSAAKAGVLGFTMALAREVAAKGVTVNAVSPGYISTAMTESVPDAVKTQIVAAIPMGRMGDPEDVANAVAFLASDEAGYITGADISVNGGMRMSAA